MPAAHLSKEQNEAVTSILTTRSGFQFSWCRRIRKNDDAAGSATRIERSRAHCLRRHSAGLKSNRQEGELLRLVQKHGMRLLLVGEVRQHVSVEAGDFLRVLESHSKLGRCQVTEIHRQIPDDYRAAVTQMAAGNVRQGLEERDRMNWIKEGQSDYLEQAAADFLRLTDQGRNLHRRLAVSFTWDENHKFTEAIREGLKERGVLPAEGMRLEVHESLRWTNQQKANWQRYEPGQVVTFTPDAIDRSLSRRSYALRKAKSSWPLPLGKK